MNTHTHTHVHTLTHRSSRQFAVSAWRATGRRRQCGREAGLCDSPSKADRQHSGGSWPGSFSVLCDIPSISTATHKYIHTHTHTQMELPAGLIVSLDDPYESHCPYSSQKKTHTLIFPLFSLTIKINTCSQNKLFTGGMQGHDFLLQWVFPPHLSKFDFCLLPFPQFL